MNETRCHGVTRKVVCNKNAAGWKPTSDLAHFQKQFFYDYVQDAFNNALNAGTNTCCFSSFSSHVTLLLSSLLSRMKNGFNLYLCQMWIIIEIAFLLPFIRLSASVIASTRQMIQKMNENKGNKISNWIHYPSVQSTTIINNFFSPQHTEPIRS